MPAVSLRVSRNIRRNEYVRPGMRVIIFIGLTLSQTIAEEDKQALALSKGDHLARQPTENYFLAKARPFFHKVINTSPPPADPVDLALSSEPGTPAEQELWNRMWVQTKSAWNARNRAKLQTSDPIREKKIIIIHVFAPAELPYWEKVIYTLGSCLLLALGIVVGLTGFATTMYNEIRCIITQIFNKPTKDELPRITRYIPSVPSSLPKLEFPGIRNHNKWSNSNDSSVIDFGADSGLEGAETTSDSEYICHNIREGAL